MANNTITYGLKNVHYAKATQKEDGSWEWGRSVSLPGAQEFTSDIVGNSSSVYADDKVVATLNQNAGRTLTLKLTELSDEFKTDILGYEKLQDGNLVEVINAPVKTFALGIEFQGDVKARRVWFYLCTTSPISESTKSKTDSVEANSTTLSITARPIEYGNHKDVTYRLANKGDTNYDTFLELAPQLPEE